MWFNKVTGEVYQGSGWKNSNRLNAYYWPSIFNSTKKGLIYNSLLIYGNSNFCLAILKVYYTSDCTLKRSYLSRESFYI